MGFLSRLLMPHVVGDQPSGEAQTQSQPASEPQPQAKSPQTQPPQHQTPTSSPSSPSTTAQPIATTTATTRRQEMTPLQRQLKQGSLLMLGAGFMAASVAVARRAVLRRQREALPLFFQGWSARPARQLDGADRSALAAQAFGLATLNVASFGVLMTGGIAWAFDLCSVHELRERTQAALRRPAGEGLLNHEDEEEMEKMMDSLLQKLGMDISKEGDEKTEAGAEDGAEKKETGSTK